MGQVISRRKELAFLLCVTLAMVAARLTLLATGFDPAYDQSMLLSNFPLEHPTDVFRPLPYFEQTTTLGHGVLMDGLAKMFGPEDMARVHAIRLLTILVFSASLLWLYFLLRRFVTMPEAMLSVAVIGSSPTALTFAVNSKHYAFEFAATIMMIAAALHYIRRPGLQSGMGVIAAGTFAALFAFVTPIIIASVGIATLTAQTIQFNTHRISPQQVWRHVAGTLAVGAVLILISAVFYFGYTSIVTVNDLAAYSERDAKKYIEINNLLSPQSVRNALEYSTYLFKLVEINVIEFESPWLRDYLPFTIPVLIFYVTGIASLWQRSPFWVTAAIAAPLLTLALNLAQVFPFSGVRQHLFAAPLVVPVVVIGFISSIQWIASKMSVPKAANAIISGLVLTAVLFSILGSLRGDSAVARLADKIEDSGDPVWAYYGAQPILRTLHPGWVDRDEVPIHGLLPHESSNRRWVLPARVEDDTGMLPQYYRSASAAIAQHDKLWLVFSMWYFDVAHIQGLEVFLQHARGPNRDCAVWRNQHKTLVAYCGPAGDVEALREQTPRDHTPEWNRWVGSGDWIRYIKGETGNLLRGEEYTPAPENTLAAKS